MHAEHDGQRPPAPTPDSGPSDEFLIDSMLGGDGAALRKLMARYDRLVRYTVFGMSRSRCAKDPQWLETIASDTWTGFVRSLQRNPDNRPTSVKAYLTRIARNQCVSAMRGAQPSHQSIDGDESDTAASIEAKTEEPAELLSRMEDLHALQGCLGDLSPEDQRIAGELVAITERRWKDAAAALDMSESTLRSRWKRVLEALRACVRGKTGKSLAPELDDGDL